MKPRDAFIAVTYACNARCEMCNIWKNPQTNQIDPVHYAKLPKSLTTINITGGEPFLRRDLVEVIRAIDSVVPSARLVFSTNGSLTDTILASIDEIRVFHKRIGVGVSIDGLEDTHDRIRGVNGLFKRGILTVKELKSRGLDDLRIAMTITQHNTKEIEKVFFLAREIGVEFTMTLAHDSEVYFKKNGVSPVLDANAIESLRRVMKSQLQSNSVKDWYRAYHTMGMIDPGHRRDFRSHCEAGRSYFFMAPNGDVYPCNVLDFRVGNLAEVDDWNGLLTDQLEKSVRNRVRDCRRDCWMVCNTRSLVMAHPFRTSMWVARNKVGWHLRS